MIDVRKSRYGVLRGKEGGMSQRARRHQHREGEKRLEKARSREEVKKGRSWGLRIIIEVTIQAQLERIYGMEDWTLLSPFRTNRPVFRGRG